jgi:hypothetical protein
MLGIYLATFDKWYELLGRGSRGEITNHLIDYSFSNAVFFMSKVRSQESGVGFWKKLELPPKTFPLKGVRRLETHCFWSKIY